MYAYIKWDVLFLVFEVTDIHAIINYCLSTDKGITCALTGTDFCMLKYHL